MHARACSQALVLDLIHNIEVVRMLMAHNVTSPEHWLWKKQLRFYLNKQSEQARAEGRGWGTSEEKLRGTTGRTAAAAAAARWRLCLCPSTASPAHRSVTGASTSCASVSRALQC